MFSTMIGLTLEGVKKWSEGLAQGELEIDASVEFSRITLGIIVQSSFGADSGSVSEDTDAIQRHFRVYTKDVWGWQRGQGLNPIMRNYPTEEVRRIRQCEEGVHRHMHNIIRRRKEARQAAVSNASSSELSPPPPQATVDLLELMLQAMGGGGDKENGKGHGNGGVIPAVLSNQELMDECVTFLIAGHETTSNLLTWTVFLLSQHPEWQEKARKEVLTVCSHAPPAYEHMTQLKLVTKILNETLRLYPPAAAISRACLVSTKVDDNLTIPKGCDVVVPITFIHRLEAFWGSDAHVFNPERFNEGENKAARQIAFIPFGSGPRNCIGQSFAVLEARVILAILLQKVQWRLAPGYRHEPHLTLTTQPKFGMPIILSPIA
eukprot:TRINITY_DN3880_c0_g1_i1.p1 TRINITY_DN3880_c0_g1~~TRINITY_DN3880_c0_g1_i1.p1  ORF type:complete len:377 (+),score=63.17 TRINITY_DN3880_c0_g1_i1:503-1633(+)